MGGRRPLRGAAASRSDPVEGLLNKRRARAVSVIGGVSSTIGHDGALIAGFKAKPLRFVEIAFEQVQTDGECSPLMLKWVLGAEFSEHMVDRVVAKCF